MFINMLMIETGLFLRSPSEGKSELEIATQWLANKK